MSEYYDPMLLLSSSGNPYTMSIMVTLKEPVDGSVLADCVEELRVRFPYYYVRTEITGNEVVVVPNPLPITVRNTWTPIILNSEESNYHLAALKYEGKRLAIEMTHPLSDGAGFLPYLKSILFLYLGRKTGCVFDPAGFKLPGDEITVEETGDPFAHVDLDKVEGPFYQKKPVEDYYRIGTAGKGPSHVFYIKLPEKDVMRYCREKDGSPNVLMSVLLARSFRRIDPASDKTINIGIAVDHKAMLGNYKNYRMFASVIDVDFPKSRANEDITTMCTIARGQIMLQAQPENSAWYIKTSKIGFEQMKHLPLSSKKELLASAASYSRWSAAVSYANSRSFGPLDPYIEDFYALAEPGVIDAVCEISCVNHIFYLSLTQNFSSDELVRAFCNELTEAGVEYEPAGDEELALSGFKDFDI